MKKALSVILCLCLLLGAAASAEEKAAPGSVEITDEMKQEEVTGDNSFLLKIWNQSGVEISYLRFDFYVGDEYRGLVASCPDEGEDFYRIPYEPATPEEMNDLRIRCSYGISDLSPEDALLQLMTGNAAEEHPVDLLDFLPVCGQVHRMVLTMDGSDAWLVQVENTVPEQTVQETVMPGEGENADAIMDRVLTFFSFWSDNSLEDMLTLCSPAWKEETENPKIALFSLLLNRTPLDLRMEKLDGTEADTVRVMKLTALMDRHNGKEAVRQRLWIEVRKGADDLWYIHPESLETWELADEELPAEATPAP